MTKKLRLLVLIFALMVMAVPQVFAADNAVTIDQYWQDSNIDDKLSSAIYNTYAENQLLQAGGCGCMMNTEPYYNSTFYVSVDMTGKVAIDTLTIESSYYGSSYESDSEAKADLQSKYDTISDLVSEYGTVKLNWRNVYPQTFYEWNEDTQTNEEKNSYSGDLSVTITLKTPSDVVSVEEILGENGFSYWRNVIASPEAILNAQIKMADDIKSMLDKKKALYEEILDKDLTEILSLDIWTGWVDSYTFDPETGKANFTFTVSATYSTATEE